MPNRILREGIITSIAVNSLSWPAEVFYRRLHSIADDYGRYYAHPSLLRAAMYPLQLEKVGDSDIGKWLLETGKAGLVRVYSVQAGDYLEIEKFGQQVRAKKSKFPDPPADDERMRSNCVAHDAHMRSRCVAHDAHMRTYAEAQSNAQTPPTPRPGGRAGGSSGNGPAFSPGFLRFWPLVPDRGRERSSRVKAFAAWNRQKCEADADTVIAGLEAWKTSEAWTKEDGQFVPGIHRWLTDRKWTEPPARSGGAEPFGPPREMTALERIRAFGSDDGTNGEGAE